MRPGHGALPARTRDLCGLAESQRSLEPGADRGCTWKRVIEMKRPSVSMLEVPMCAAGNVFERYSDNVLRRDGIASTLRAPGIHDDSRVSDIDPWMVS